jgi:hypothetical protein
MRRTRKLRMRLVLAGTAGLAVAAFAARGQPHIRGRPGSVTSPLTRARASHSAGPLFFYDSGLASVEAAAGFLRRLRPPREPRRVLFFFGGCSPSAFAPSVVWPSSGDGT